jgi:BirA family biotin operon repressor/biotin-[acetyl-CoA-carboxylase] ligase
LWENAGLVVPILRSYGAEFMNQQTLEHFLAGLPLGGIRYFDSVGSTNDAAAEWAEEEAADYSLVIADEQLRGRGRAGRKWITQPGSGLAFSLILRTSSQENLFLTSLSTRFTCLGTLAVVQVLRDHYSLPAQIKWPNDVLINRRKVCGVLVESHWVGDQLSSVILGIGINIATHGIPQDGALIYPATSVEQELDYPVNRITLLCQILSEIIRWRPHLLAEIFLQTWEANLAFRDEWVQVTVSSGRKQVLETSYVGRILGLKPDGALRLRTDSGDEIFIRHGEISQPDGDIRIRPVDRLLK